VPPDVRLPSEAVLLERIEAQRTCRVEDRCYVLPSETDDLGWPSPKSTKALPPEGAAAETVACS